MNNPFYNRLSWSGKVLYRLGCFESNTQGGHTLYRLRTWNPFTWLIMLSYVPTAIAIVAVVEGFRTFIKATREAIEDVSSSFDWH